MKKKVTLSLDSEIYKQFQRYCKDNDIMLSKRVERIMSEQLKKSIKKHKPLSNDIKDFLRGDENVFS